MYNLKQIKELHIVSYDLERDEYPWGPELRQIIRNTASHLQTWGGYPGTKKWRDEIYGREI